MAGVLLVRADDNLVIGVRWSGFTVSGAGANALLTAGAGASLLLTLPPQHLAEETSPPGSSGPQKPVTAGGPTVSVWRAELSGTSRLKVSITPGRQIPLTIEGVLTAVVDAPIVVDPDAPGTEATAIELPYRLVIAPAARGGAPGAAVACRHPSRVDPAAAAHPLWRTRIVDAAHDRVATLTDAHLQITVADRTRAESADPVFKPPDPPNVIPLSRADRITVHRETTLMGRPAKVTRLELSSLGGTLDAAGLFPSFEWEHRTVLGRDMRVRTLFRGAMYPLGHPAVFEKFSERVFDPHASAGGAAVLRTVRVLTILEPVRRAPADSPVRRSFPLGDVEITRTIFTNLATEEWTDFTFPGLGAQPTFFTPKVPNPADPNTVTPVLFPISCTTHVDGVRRELKMDIPLVFVADVAGASSLTNPALATALQGAYPATRVEVTPTDVDLVGAGHTPLAPGQPEPTDVYEVHSVTIAGFKGALDLADGYRPMLTALDVVLPALRPLRNVDPRRTVSLAEDYIKKGLSEHVLLKMAEKADIDFTSCAERSGGLLAPKYATDAISRTFGPVNVNALIGPNGVTDPRTLFPDDNATLLGFPLRSLLEGLDTPPQLTSLPTPDPGAAPKITMSWKAVKLTTMGAFVAEREGQAGQLDLDITTGTDDAETKCTIKDFTLKFPPDKAVLELSFATMTYVQQGHKSPTLNVDGVGAKFVGDLAIVEKMSQAVQLGDAGKLVDVTPTGIAVHYALPASPIASGVFIMRNIAFRSQVLIPFDGKPVSISLGFSSRANPFQLAVMMFGGTGYLELELNRDGIQRFEAALEFGALIAVDFVIASGEVYALGGVRFVVDRGNVTVAGYLRIGGSVEVLGLITVSIELCITLEYRTEEKALVGRATLVIEIDLTLWSDSVEIDSGEWRLPGTDEVMVLASAEIGTTGLDLWAEYRGAYADIG